MTAREYIETIAQELSSVRGRGLLLSPADAQLALSWHAREVPLAAVIAQVRKAARLRARSARQKGYQLRKQLHALMGHTIANSWQGEWQDSQTGARMSGHGVEIWVMRGGKIAVWEAAFNFKEAGKKSVMGIV